MASNRTVFHVVPYKDRWQIKRDGVADFEVPTKEEAITKATSDAKLMHPSQVVIHNQDGKISEEHAYGD